MSESEQTTPWREKEDTRLVRPGERLMLPHAIPGDRSHSPAIGSATAAVPERRDGISARATTATAAVAGRTHIEA